jgi:hypothetical protein
MDLMLSGILWENCLVFLDDIIVYSAIVDQHVERLSAVFGRLVSANLELKPSKWKLFQREVRFLGHVISETGIAADPEKVSVVVSWPQPRNLTELRSFLGLASYYRRFVSGFANIARPLHQLISKEEQFIWQDAQETAFRSLNEHLIKLPYWRRQQTTANTSLTPMPVSTDWVLCYSSGKRVAFASLRMPVALCLMLRGNIVPLAESFWLLSLGLAFPTILV